MMRSISLPMLKYVFVFLRNLLKHIRCDRKIVYFEQFHSSTFEKTYFKTFMLSNHLTVVFFSIMIACMLLLIHVSFKIYVKCYNILFSVSQYRLLHP